jgi:hypothetical protein
MTRQRVKAYPQDTVPPGFHSQDQWERQTLQESRVDLRDKVSRWFPAYAAGSQRPIKANSYQHNVNNLHAAISRVKGFVLGRSKLLHLTLRARKTFRLGYRRSGPRQREHI